MNPLDNHNDDNPSDGILDSMLTDLLGSKQPPNLSNKIQRRVNAFADQTGCDDVISVFSVEELNEAARFAQRDLELNYVMPPPVQVTAKQLGPWLKVSLIGGAALAASIAIILFTIDFSGSKSADNSIAKQPRIDRSIQVDAGTDRVVENIQNSDPVGSVADVGKSGSNATSIAKEKELPSVKPENRIAEAATRIGTPLPIRSYADVNQAAGAIERMDRIAVVSVIDQQFEQVWDRLGVKPTASLKNDAMLDRLSMVILGRLPTAAERESYRKGNSGDRNGISDIIDQLVQHDDFSRYWSIVLAEYYLGRPISERSELSQPELAFVAWIEKSIVAKQSMGRVAFELVRSALDEAGEKDLTLWAIDSIENGKRDYYDASNKQRRFGPSSDNERHFGLASLSRNLLRISGTQDIACLQCHSSKTAKSSDGELVKADASSDETKYWSVASLFSAIDAADRNGIRRKADSEKIGLYREDLTGKLVSVVPSLPDGTAIPLQSERLQSLSKWFERSTTSRESIVDVVWRSMLGDPLVPPIGLVNDEGDLERRDLRSFLATRMLADGDDLQSLVGWVALSDLIRVGSTDVSATVYRKASKSQLDQLQKKRHVFADFETKSRRDIVSGMTSISQAHNWMALQRKSTTVDAALAQTDDSVSAQPNKQDGMDHELPTSLIHSGLEIEFPAHHTTSVSESLAKSSLDWKGIADHAFLICNSRFASKDELDLSQRLLEECEQNRMQASRLLLTSLLDSH